MAWRCLTGSCTAVLVATLGTAPALAATTWTMQPGGTITATSGKIVLKDTRTGSVLPCPSSAASGTLKRGSGLAGTGIGKITSVTFTGPNGECAGPGGPLFALRATAGRRASRPRRSAGAGSSGCRHGIELSRRKDVPRMTGPDDTDDEIRPGDWAYNRHDDNGEPGEVLDVLPFRGSTPRGGPDTFLYDVAVVRRGNRKTAERLAHLVKVAPP